MPYYFSLRADAIRPKTPVPSFCTGFSGAHSTNLILSNLYALRELGLNWDRQTIQQPRDCLVTKKYHCFTTETRQSTSAGGRKSTDHATHKVKWDDIVNWRRLPCGGS